MNQVAFQGLCVKAGGIAPQRIALPVLAAAAYRWMSGPLGPPAPGEPQLAFIETLIILIVAIELEDEDDRDELRRLSPRMRISANSVRGLDALATHDPRRHETPTFGACHAWRQKQPASQTFPLSRQVG